MDDRRTNINIVLLLLMILLLHFAICACVLSIFRAHMLFTRLDSFQGCNLDMVEIEVPKNDLIYERNILFKLVSFVCV
jgi:hypothetical protein